MEKFKSPLVNKYLYIIMIEKLIGAVEEEKKNFELNEKIRC